MKMDLNRRNFLRTGALAAATMATTRAVPASAAVSPAVGAAEPPIKLGLASYTFRNFTRAQLIGFMK